MPYKFKKSRIESLHHCSFFLQKMANITEDFLAKNDTDFPAVVFVIFEEKLVAYAKENLNKQHNGNVSIKRKKFSKLFMIYKL